MNNSMTAMRRGFGIIEIIVTIAILSVIVLVIGRSLASLTRVYDASNNRTRAFVYARQPIEIINGLKNEYFGCSCSSDVCSGNVCTRNVDGQQCALRGPYTSCWTAYPAQHDGVTRFYVEQVGGNWQLHALIAGDSETVVATPVFHRVVNITSLTRNADGDIDPAGNPDDNTKLIKSTITWQERGTTRQIEQSIILTAWENF